MKLTQEQIESIKKDWGDWEYVHAKYDGLMKERLQELDLEFVKSLDDATEGADFWYA